MENWVELLMKFAIILNIKLRSDRIDNAQTNIEFGTSITLKPNTYTLNHFLTKKYEITIPLFLHQFFCLKLHSGKQS